MDRVRWVRVALGLAFAGLAVLLILGDKPGETAELVRQGEKVGSLDLVSMYRYWISAGNALLVLLLWWSAPRWLRPRETPSDPSLAPPTSHNPAFAVLVAGAVICAAMLAWPRLEFDFWDDEESTVFFFADGGYTYNQRGELIERDRSWRDTLHYRLNRTHGANNHVPHSILVRLTLDAWRLVARPELRWPDERVARIPAYLAGLAAIAATALLLRRLGFPTAGVFTAWLLAVHPWMIRYISEARGYSLVLLLLPLLLIAPQRAFERGTWRRWATFAAAGALLLWTYPGAGMVVFAVNLAVVAELVRRRHAGGGVHAVRWFTSNVVAGAIWAQIMLPNFLILTFHIPFGDDDPKPRMIWDQLGHLWSGTFWRLRHAQDHYAELVDFAWPHPWIFSGLVALAVALILLGALRLLRRGGAHAWLVPVLMLPAPLTFWIAWTTEALYHPWYAIYGLPSLVILLGIGFETAFARVTAERLRIPLTVGLMLLFGVGYLASTRHVLQALRASPIQETKKAVALMRPVRDPLDPANEEILTVSWMRTPWYYDPLVHKLRGSGGLTEYLAEADATGKSLFVTYTRPTASARNAPDLVALAQDPALFEPIAEFYGFEPRGHMLVFRYRGAMADDALGTNAGKRSR
jgi:hypothetical protein